MDSTTPSTRASRRSAANLSHLTLAPLTSRSTVDDDEDLGSTNRYRSSYIEGRSTPSTPGILSRSPSGTRLYTQGTTVSHASSPSILKSKSAVQLNKLQASRPLKSGLTSSEWLTRAGQAITSEARESKGQSWLASRASSTSLIDRGDDDGEVGGWAADDEFSRSHSLTQSRAGSKYGSRRGSARQSTEFLTPKEYRVSREDYFDVDMTAEPDFVDEEEVERRYLKDLLDEAEINQLARQRGLGLGNWVDRFMGWSMFAVDEKEEENALPAAPTDVESPPIRRRRREEGNRVILAERPPPAPADGAVDQNNGGDGNWQDVAWLLSVASKVIL